MTATEPKEYIQVGYTALRRPGTGEFLPAVPLYIRADESAAAAEDRLAEDLGGLFAQRMKAYRDGCREAGAAI